PRPALPLPRPPRCRPGPGAAAKNAWSAAGRATAAPAGTTVPGFGPEPRPPRTPGPADPKTAAPVGEPTPASARPAPPAGAPPPRPDPGSRRARRRPPRCRAG